MTDTPITDALRKHLAENPGDIDAIVDAMAKIEAKAGEFADSVRRLQF